MLRLQWVLVRLGGATKANATAASCLDNVELDHGNGPFIFSVLQLDAYNHCCNAPKYRSGKVYNTRIIILSIFRYTQGCFHLFFVCIACVACQE